MGYTRGPKAVGEGRASRGSGGSSGRSTPGGEEPETTVFISYAREERQFASWLSRSLEKTPKADCRTVIFHREMP